MKQRNSIRFYFLEKKERNNTKRNDTKKKAKAMVILYSVHDKIKGPKDHRLEMLTQTTDLTLINENENKMTTHQIKWNKNEAIMI